MYGMMFSSSTLTDSTYKCTSGSKSIYMHQIIKLVDVQLFTNSIHLVDIVMLKSFGCMMEQINGLIAHVLADQSKT